MGARPEACQNQKVEEPAMTHLPSQPGVRRTYDGHWEWFLSTEEPPYAITGKYLFFSTDRDLLVQIAVEELQSGQFHHAKIPMEGKNLSPEYVLCLYYEDDSRKQELAAKYRSREGLKYRYWKSDEATLRGAYSERFLESLQPEDRERFTGQSDEGTV
jgi:hypothetical protein